MKKLGLSVLGFLSALSLLCACSNSGGQVASRAGGANVNSLASGTPPPYNATAQNPVHQAPYGAQRNTTGGR